MRNFSDLSEREILALAIGNEEEDGRIYADMAESLRADYPTTAHVFLEMAQEESGHRHDLLTLYQEKFGDHIPLIRRQDVKGFIERKSLWLARPLGLEKVRAQAELMEAESKRFYLAAARHSTDAAIRQLLGDLAAEERRHETRAVELAPLQLDRGPGPGKGMGHRISPAAPVRRAETISCCRSSRTAPAAPVRS